jgi:hypothetical protein
VLDRDAAPPRRPVRHAEAALRTYAPPDAARISISTWPDGLPGPASSQLVPFLAGFLLLGLLDDQIPRAVLPVVLATVALSAGVQLTRLAVRHLWLDRRVSPS